MQHHTRPTRIEAQINDYAAALFREVVRRLKGRRLHDADDIAQRVCEMFLLHAEVFMAKYTDAGRFAAAVTRNAEISYDRTQRAQRGEGVYLVRSEDGTMHPRRQYISGNAPVGGHWTTGHAGEQFDLITDRSEHFTDRVLNAMAADELLEHCLRGLEQHDRELLLRIDGNGETVLDLAIERGQARETVSRRVSRIRQQVEQNVAISSSNSPTTLLSLRNERPTA
jgi:RNA polymerase sigma factor (sigma-70 family)